MNAGFRTQLLTQQVIFTDGIAGCGKTMLAPIISTFDRVELMTYAFEIQWYCAQHALGQLTLDGAKNLIQLQADLKLYNTMMSREVNFRPSDLSSAQRDSRPQRYIDRQTAPGDEVIPARIEKERPIMNLVVHNLLAYSEPLVAAFGKKAFFIDVVRHPLYMLKQQALNYEKLIPNNRDIAPYIRYKEKDMPFYVKGWEEDYLRCETPFDKSVYYTYHLWRMAAEKEHLLQLLRVPFEPFVLDPNPWMDRIRKFLSVTDSEVTAEKLRTSNVPRKKIADGVDLEIYRRCGWTPPKGNLTEREELNERYKLFSNELSPHARVKLDEIIHAYESKYWKPD